MQDLTLTLVQCTLNWHDAVANRGMFTEKLQAVAGTTDLVVLPEMFTTGFTMDAQAYAEPMDGPSVAWMAAQAARLGAVVTGSLIVEDQGCYFNRLIWMRPDGSFEHYDKRHLFRMADEHQHYQAGDRRLIVELAGWRICPLVCYDLRFPVWCRNRGDFDLLIFVANWPKRRSHHWRSLLPARAIENLACVAAVNRVGEDGNGIDYAGDSMAIDAQGRTLAQLAHVEAIQTIRFPAQHLIAYRERFPANRDADDFSLIERQ